MHPRYTDTPYLSGGAGAPQLSTDAAIPAGGGGPFPRLGELGKVYRDPFGVAWQRVKGNAAFTHAAAVKEVAYWADATKMLVDTDLTDSEEGRNQVAGHFVVGHTLPLINQLFWICQEKRQATLTGITGVNFATVASSIIASATVGQVDYVAAGTASTYLPVGILHTAVDHSGGAGDTVVDFLVPSLLY